MESTRSVAWNPSWDGMDSMRSIVWNQAYGLHKKAVRLFRSWVLLCGVNLDVIVPLKLKAGQSNPHDARYRGSEVPRGCKVPAVFGTACASRRCCRHRLRRHKKIPYHKGSELKTVDNCF